MPFANQQVAADFLFQAFDFPTDSGLTDLQRFRCSGHAFEVDDGGEGP